MASGEGGHTLGGPRGCLLSSRRMSPERSRRMRLFRAPSFPTFAACTGSMKGPVQRESRRARGRLFERKFILSRLPARQPQARQAGGQRWWLRGLVTSSPAVLLWLWGTGLHWRSAQATQRECTWPSLPADVTTGRRPDPEPLSGQDPGVTTHSLRPPANPGTQAPASPVAQRTDAALLVGCDDHCSRCLSPRPR